MKLTKLVHDIKTNEIQEIDLSAKELKEVELTQNKKTDDNNKLQSEIESKILAKQTLLDRLGITADEAKLLLG